MKIILNFSFIFYLMTTSLYAEREKIDFSMVISGGVSLGAYESGYNWALINMLKREKAIGKYIAPELRSIAGASAGSINALLSAMYWCQEDSVLLENSVDDNLFYETWVNLGLEDLSIWGKDPNNTSSLYTHDSLRKKGEKIIAHLNQPIFKKNCEVPLGVAVTKAYPIVETISGLKVKNQNFSVPLTFKEQNGQGIVENRVMPPSTDFYISIPGIEKDKNKLVDLLLASGAFPAFFQQVKLDYRYKGENHSHYFIDGGLYDNVPLELATALDDRSDYFFFMDPNNMRKEVIEVKKKEEENLPVGFITPNIIPVLKSFSIMQSMKLYETINQNFRGDSSKTLMLSSRYHPLTGGFLGHFGAFLDINFRVYDYYVGVYDAIYHSAAAFIKKDQYVHMTQIELMNYLKTVLGVDDNPEALSAYNLLLNTEFYHLKPKTTDRFSAVYNAFNLKKNEATSYDNAAFKAFLLKLDMKYLEKSKNSFLTYAKEDIDNWHKRPLRRVISRIAMLENERKEAGKEHAFNTEMALLAWGTTSFTKEKKGFEFLPFNVPDDAGKEDLRTALRVLPGEVALDIRNGGMSFGYSALYHLESKEIISGFEGKASYISIHDEADFVRGDISVYKEYNDFFKLGIGGSFFGNTEGSFYQKEGAYGLNTYVDIMDIFRLTYVRRDGDVETRNYFYLGIENIPSLIYWLNR